jgi:hypothetical protein
MPHLSFNISFFGTLFDVSPDLLVWHTEETDDKGAKIVLKKNLNQEEFTQLSKYRGRTFPNGGCMYIQLMILRLRQENSRVYLDAKPPRELKYEGT